MEKAAVTHYETKEYMYPLNRRTLLVKLKFATDSAHTISIIYWNKFNNAELECELESFCIHGSSDFYTAKLSFDESAKYIRYYFVIRGKDHVVYYSPYGLTPTVPNHCFEYSYTNVDDIVTVPDWAKGAIGYQIFPERFFNGDPGNDPSTVEQWNGMPSRSNFFGGDLRGIIQQFHHIEQMGIDILYLTPIFHSPSNHKYDTIDYLAIDPSFGERKDLQELVELCHRHHMKIVLDGVFNHMGYYSDQFQDAMLRGKQSPYWDWFYVHGDQIDSDSINYECVGYYKWMPKLKYSNPDVREYFLRVGEYWIKEAGIDGWRLDVADEVDFTFWQEFRKRIKRIDPNLLLIGETWKNGSDLLRGDQMDSIMNYRFRDAVIDYFANSSITKDSFAYRIESILFDYPQATHNVLYNLLGSHDTARFLTVCKEDVKKLKLAVVFQMTFPGMSFIYYGDEIGMTGETDPDCRRPMAWDLPNRDLVQFYQKLIRIRKCSKALKYGDFRHIDTASEVYVFRREFENEIVIVFINNNADAHSLFLCLTKADYAIRPFEGGDHLEYPGYLTVNLPANSFEIVHLEKEGETFKIQSIERE